MLCRRVLASSSSLMEKREYLGRKEERDQGYLALIPISSSRRKGRGRHGDHYGERGGGKVLYPLAVLLIGKERHPFEAPEERRIWFSSPSTGVHVRIWGEGGKGGPHSAVRAVLRGRGTRNLPKERREENSCAPLQQKGGGKMSSLQQS